LLAALALSRVRFKALLKMVSPAWYHRAGNDCRQ
jgi:hypothetical protein